MVGTLAVALDSSLLAARSLDFQKAYQQGTMYYDRMIVTGNLVGKSLFVSMKGDNCGDAVFE